MAEERDEFVSRGAGRRQVRKRRKDGWTKSEIELFLKHYRLTANVTASAAAAGKSAAGVYRLRETDAEFAAAMDAALEQADVRLRSKLALYAETRGKTAAPAGDEPEEAPMADFDPDVALKFLAHNSNRLAGVRQQGGARPRVASRAELIEALVKLLAMLKKRREKARRAGK